MHIRHTHTHTASQEIGQQNVVQKGKQTVGKLLNNIAQPDHIHPLFVLCQQLEGCVMLQAGLLSD